MIDSSLIDSFLIDSSLINSSLIDSSGSFKMSKAKKKLSLKKFNELIYFIIYSTTFRLYLLTQLA